jgi:hypothetical protein
MEVKDELVVGPRWGLIPGQTGRLTVCRKITLALALTTVDNRHRNVALQDGEISTLKEQNMVLCPVGLRPEKYCAGEAQ